MDAGLLGIALGAGLLAAVNPCGFALLPAYVSMLVGDGAETGRVGAVGRALGLTSAMTAGFSAVFLVFGLILAPVASQLQAQLPWFTVVLGTVLVLVGAWMVAGRTLRLPRLRVPGASTSQPAPLRRSFASMAGFGASYALASLSCTIAPFLAVVVSGLRTDVWGGLALFLAYALGMGLVVGTLAVATALASAGLIAWLRRSGRWMPRIGGAVLLLTGAYVAYYGAWELRVLAGAEATDPVVDAAAGVQQVLATGVASLGLGGWLLLFGASVLATAWFARRRQTGARFKASSPSR